MSSSSRYLLHTQGQSILLYYSYNNCHGIENSPETVLLFLHRWLPTGSRLHYYSDLFLNLYIQIHSHNSTLVLHDPHYSMIPQFIDPPHSLSQMVLTEQSGQVLLLRIIFFFLTSSVILLLSITFHSIKRYQCCWNVTANAWYFANLIKHTIHHHVI